MELQNLYRTATQEELSFYQDRLDPLQDEVLEIASIYEGNIYLTGGTALSRFYYEHRFSDDLDFFTTTDDLRAMLHPQRFAIANDLAARLQQLDYTIEIERLDIYFARFFVVRPPCRLKIEFVKEFNLIGNLTKTDKGIYINTLEDLGANKVSKSPLNPPLERGDFEKFTPCERGDFENFSPFHRVKFPNSSPPFQRGVGGDKTFVLEMKDIIDLYFITQTIPLERLFELADIKRIPVAYDRLLAINSQGLSGKVLMRQDLDVQTQKDFLEYLKQRTEAEVKKKLN